MVAVAPSRRISGWVQWWPVRTHTPERPRISPTSCGCTPSITKETSAPRPAASAGPCSVMPGHLAQAGRARRRTSASSWARISSIPIARIQSTAAPRPIASAICEVPASNLWGSSVQVDSVGPTVRIMWPPPMNGGIASSSSRRPCRTPIPVGP